MGRSPRGEFAREATDTARRAVATDRHMLRRSRWTSHHDGDATVLVTPSLTRETGTNARGCLTMR